jgi:hypothetical protein
MMPIFDVIFFSKLVYQNRRSTIMFQGNICIDPPFEQVPLQRTESVVKVALSIKCAGNLFKRYIFHAEQTSIGMFT